MTVKFQITVCAINKPDHPWTEDYGPGAANTRIWDDDYPGLHEPVESLEQAKAWSELAMRRFNATLRPNETPRMLLSVMLLPDAPEPEPEEDDDDLEQEEEFDELFDEDDEE